MNVNFSYVHICFIIEVVLVFLDFPTKTLNIGVLESMLQMRVVHSLKHEPPRVLTVQFISIPILVKII